MQQISVRQTRNLLGMVVGVCLASACSQTPQQAAPASPDVWATVDGRDILRGAVDKAYSGSVQPTPTPASDEEIAGNKLNILDELINQELLLARANAQGLAAADADVDKTFTERKGGTSDDAFLLQLTQRGLSVDDVKQNVRRELSIQKLFERDVTSKVSVADAEIAAFYEQNKAQFNLTEPQYRLAQIGIMPGKDPQLRNRQNDDAGTPAEAKTKVEMVMSKIRAGADFGDMALDYSEDLQSLAQGGDLGFVPASTLSKVAPQLRNAVMKMNPGEVTMVAVGSNYTILMLVGREPAGQRELANPTVKDGIRDLLKSRKEEVLRAAYISTLRNEAKVTNHLARQIIDAQGKLPPGVVPAAK